MSTLTEFYHDLAGRIVKELIAYPIGFFSDLYVTDLYNKRSIAG